MSKGQKSNLVKGPATVKTEAQTKILLFREGPRQLVSPQQSNKCWLYKYTCPHAISQNSSDDLLNFEDFKLICLVI